MRKLLPSVGGRTPEKPEFFVFRGCVVSLRCKCGSTRSLTFTAHCFIFFAYVFFLVFPVSGWFFCLRGIGQATNLDLVAQIFAWHVHKRKCLRQLKANNGGSPCNSLTPWRFSSSSLANSWGPGSHNPAHAIRVVQSRIWQTGLTCLTVFLTPPITSRPLSPSSPRNRSAGASFGGRHFFLTIFCNEPVDLARRLKKKEENSKLKPKNPQTKPARSKEKQKLGQRGSLKCSFKLYNAFISAKRDGEMGFN